MNRTIGNILFVGYASSNSSSSKDQGEVKPINAEDAYLILENSSSVLIVPGYGMAVAQAQHVVRELGELLEENNKNLPNSPSLFSKPLRLHHENQFFASNDL